MLELFYNKNFLRTFQREIIVHFITIVSTWLRSKLWKYYKNTLILAIIIIRVVSIITYCFLEEKEIDVLPRICIRSLDKSKDARIDIYGVNCIETFYYTFITIVVSLLKCEF